MPDKERAEAEQLKEHEEIRTALKQMAPERMPSLQSQEDPTGSGSVDMCLR